MKSELNYSYMPNKNCNPKKNHLRIFEKAAGFLFNFAINIEIRFYNTQSVQVCSGFHYI